MDHDKVKQQDKPPEGGSVRQGAAAAWPICLGYVLSDPSVSSVIVRADDPERLAILTAVPERDMPPGLAAQIEMARVIASAAA